MRTYGGAVFFVAVITCVGCSASRDSDASTDAGIDTASDTWRVPDSVREACGAGMLGEDYCVGCLFQGCCVRGCAPDGYYTTCEGVGHPCDVGPDSAVDGGLPLRTVYACANDYGPALAHSLERACSVDADCTAVAFACRAAVFGARNESATAFAAFAAVCGCTPPTDGWGADDRTIGPDPSAAHAACVGGVCTSMFAP